MLRILRKTDWFLIIPAISINLIGLVVFLILAQSEGVFEYMSSIPLKHGVFTVVGVVLFALLVSMPLEFFFSKLSVIALNVISIGMMIIALLLPPYANTHRWINLNLFLIQPSELYKPILILTTAYALGTRDYRLILFPLIAILLILISPDLGMALLQLLVMFGMFVFWLTQRYELANRTVFILAWLLFILIIGNTVSEWLIWLGLPLLLFYTLKHFGIKTILMGCIAFSTVLLLIEAIPLLYKAPFLHDYQRARLKPFVEQIQKKGPTALFDLSVENFHTRQARIALGSGGLLGKGPSGITQSRLRFLPEAETDFMYATLSEMFGVLGAFIVILLYTIMILRLLYLLKYTSNTLLFQYLMVGVCVLLITEIVLGIGINLALFPTKGQPLPFLSYGGSSLITHYLLLALASQVYYNYRKLV